MKSTLLTATEAESQIVATTDPAERQKIAGSFEKQYLAGLKPEARTDEATHPLSHYEARLRDATTDSERAQIMADFEAAFEAGNIATE